MRLLVVGGGRPVQFLAQRLLSARHGVTVICRSPGECRRLARLVDTTIVQGDGSDERVLSDAGARSADVVLAATPSDPDNFVVCQTAKARFEVPRAVALVNDPENQPVFQALGIEAVSTALTVASLIEQRAALDQVTELIPALQGQVTMSEVTLSPASPVVGRRLADITLPHQALVAVLVRDGAVEVPRGATVLEAGDRVLVVTLAAAREPTLALLTGNGRGAHGG